MTSDRWVRTKQLLQQVLELPKERRAAFITEASGSDIALKQEVESLLQFESVEADPEAVHLGPYRVIREIGRGGMGVVYLAERDDKLYEKQVAVKVLETILQPAVLVKRFEVERRILARLEHPSIAHLIDAGMSAAGKPYFVLEYVEGVTLRDYLSKYALSEKQKLELFALIARAVGYAHNQLIVHLDLKPANVLVTADGKPKLLDFGLAKVLDPVTGDGGDLTLINMRILTPAYASPEQQRGEALTVASDIYSLGILLREMLTGERNGKAEGDLENILNLATREEPRERYQSVEKFADDVDLYLKGMPVSAREDTILYRARKFVKRRRVPVAAATIAILALVLGFSVAVYQANRAARRFNEVRQVANSFLFEFHDAIEALPGATPVREMVLERAQKYLDSLASEAGSDLDLKRELATAYLKTGIAQGLYFESNLGKRTEARKNFQKALTLFQQVQAARPDDLQAQLAVAGAKLRLIGSSASQEQSPEELAELEKVITTLESISKKHPLDDQTQTVLAYGYVGKSLRLGAINKVPEAMASIHRAVAIIDELAARNRSDSKIQRTTAVVHKRLAASYLQLERNFAKATEETLYAKAIDSKALQQNPGSAIAKMDVATDLGYLGVMMQRRDPEAAEDDFRKALSMRKELVEADPKDVQKVHFLIRDYVRLSGLLAERKQWKEAGELAGRGLQLLNESAKNEESVADAVDLHIILARYWTAVAKGSSACAPAKQHLDYARAALAGKPAPKKLLAVEEALAGCL